MTRSRSLYRLWRIEIPSDERRWADRIEAATGSGVVEVSGRFDVSP